LFRSPTCASSTSGSTSVGPGRKKRPNGGSSTFGAVAVSDIVAPVMAVGGAPPYRRRGQEGWYPLCGGACHVLRVWPAPRMKGGCGGPSTRTKGGCGWGRPVHPSAPPGSPPPISPQPGWGKVGIEPGGGVRGGDGDPRDGRPHPPATRRSPTRQGGQGGGGLPGGRAGRKGLPHPHPPLLILPQDDLHHWQQRVLPDHLVRRLDDGRPRDHARERDEPVHQTLHLEVRRAVADHHDGPW